MFNEFISKRIFELRNSNNISARKMSLDLGLSNSYITQIENGKKSMSIDMLFNICTYFDMTLLDFFKPYYPTQNLSHELVTFLKEQKIPIILDDEECHLHISAKQLNHLISKEWYKWTLLKK